MTNEIGGAMDRQPTLQTITWLLNLRRYGQLDLNPPYQRRSVWSLREKQRFLDTVMRNYPSPAIYLHTTFDNDGNPTYHVVDGKQRLSAIFDFVDGKLRLDKHFGDVRLDGKKWKDLEELPAVRKILWTYQLTVEQIDDVQEALVREIFERLNRNSRKLEPQEMRHARYDGWLISYLESQAESEVWKTLKVSTTAKSKRMADVQMLSELASVMIAQTVSGFDHEAIDTLYADFEDPAETRPDFDVDFFTNKFERSALFLRDIESHNGVVTRRATARGHLYSIWSIVALADLDSLDASTVADSYSKFMDEYADLKDSEAAEPTRDRSADNPDVWTYLQNSGGASTEGPQRRARHVALSNYLSKGSDDS